jgi:peptidoglycan/xylan/chitin deacetylase (PgdA/CDA1 family)
MAYLPILTYHRLLAGDPTRSADPKRIAVSAAQFESHLKWLRRLGYQSVSLQDYVADLRAGKPPARKTIGLTFDDGYEDVFTLGLPLLKKYGFTALTFSVPGEMGGCNRWDDSRSPLMSREQFRAWHSAGMEVGAHTSSHVHLPAVDPARARQEIVESKRTLEDVLQRSVPLFAYPYGEYSATVKTLVQEAGFAAAFATDRAPQNHEADFFALRRAVVFPKSNAWNILWKAQRWYPAYQDSRR